jgi:O-antigen ligase
MEQTLAASPNRIRRTASSPTPAASDLRVAKDCWPHTKRPAPWALAAFICMLWLLPFDAITLPIPLPVDSTLDRFALAGLVAIVLVTHVPTMTGPRHGPNRIHAAMLVLLAVWMASVFLHLDVLAAQDELMLSVKKLSLVGSYLALFAVIVVVIRPDELKPFMVLTLACASLTALGTVVEYRTAVNYFYTWSSSMLGHAGVYVQEAPPDPAYGRPTITGPTGHGLAVAAILAMVLPFALIGLIEARSRASRILYGLAVAALLAGGVATLRKTAFVAPVAALVVVIAYRPAQMVRLLPLGVVLILGIKLMAPGALSGVKYQFAGGSQNSNAARTIDYDGVRPDVLDRPLLGRGFGSYDPQIWQRKVLPTGVHRVLDNQDLLTTVETGFLGLLAYLGLLVSGGSLGHRTARRRDPVFAPYATAGVAAIAAFIICNSLFDVLAFPHAPYVCFFVLGVITVAARGAESPVPKRATRPRDVLSAGSLRAPDTSPGVATERRSTG